jgi:hypothetical protein
MLSTYTGEGYGEESDVTWYDSKIGMWNPGKQVAAVGDASIDVATKADRKAVTDAARAAHQAAVDGGFNPGDGVNRGDSLGAWVFGANPGPTAVVKQHLTGGDNDSVGNDNGWGYTAMLMAPASDPTAVQVIGNVILDEFERLVAGGVGVGGPLTPIEDAGGSTDWTFSEGSSQEFVLGTITVDWDDPNGRGALWEEK